MHTQALSASETPWEVEGLPVKLLDVLRHKLDGTPVELPPITLPQAVPGVDAPDAAGLGLVDKAEAALRLQDRCATPHMLGSMHCCISRTTHSLAVGFGSTTPQ